MLLYCHSDRDVAVHDLLCHVAFWMRLKIGIHNTVSYVIKRGRKRAESSGHSRHDVNNLGAHMPRSAKLSYKKASSSLSQPFVLPVWHQHVQQTPSLFSISLSRRFAVMYLSANCGYGLPALQRETRLFRSSSRWHAAICMKNDCCRHLEILSAPTRNLLWTSTEESHEIYVQYTATK